MESGAASQEADAIVREALDVEIPAPWAPNETLSIALDIFSSLDSDCGALLFCAPGGGVNRRYYDMKSET